MKKLNIGCGNDHREGYLNIDAIPNIGADLIHDITTPFPLQNNSVDEILAQDIFEHVTSEQLSKIVQELHRILVVKGLLSVRLPNIEDIWKRFSNDPETRNLFLYGETKVTGVWGSHKAGYTLNSIVKQIMIHGFKLIKFKFVNTNYELEFLKTEIPKLKGVVFINQTLAMGGAENFNTQLLLWLSKMEVPIKAWTNFRPFNDKLSFFKINTRRIPLVIDIIGDWKGLIKGFFYLPFAIIYYAHLTYRNRNFGTILLSGFIEKILITPWAKLLNIPVVWIEFGSLQTVFAKFFGFPKFLYRLVSKMPDYVIETSEHTQRNNVNISGFSYAKTNVLPCGINPLFAVSGRTEKLTAYCVSRMEQGKGQDILIESWSHVIKKFPSAKLYIIGEGGFGAKLEMIVKKLNLKKSVIFLGWVKNLTETVSRYEIGVFPSNWPLEGFGLVLLEAMSLEKPIVCFDAGPYNEIVNPDCAILVEKRSTRKLADAIITLFSKPRLARQLSVNSKKRFMDLFTMEKVGLRFEEILLKAQMECIVKKILK